MIVIYTLLALLVGWFIMDKVHKYMLKSGVIQPEATPVIMRRAENPHTFDHERVDEDGIIHLKGRVKRD